MELAIYIKNLLYNYDKIVVPGLGTFQTMYKPAQINSHGRTISPPSKTIVFSGESIAPDDVLADFIANHKNISKSAAENSIETQVKSLIQKLDSCETIYLEGIGYFSKDDNKVLRFEPEQDANFLTDSFGLSKIDFNPIEFKPKQNQQMAKAPKKRSYAWLIIILLILVLAGGGVATYYYNPGGITDRVKGLLATKPKAIEVSKNTETAVVPQKDTAKPTELEKKVDNSTDKKIALSIKNDIEAKKVKENLAFYIIAGSFKTYERASILAKQLKKEGYTPEVIQFDQNLYRVSLGEYKDRAEADASFEKIKAKKGAEAVWLLKKNL